MRSWREKRGEETYRLPCVGCDAAALEPSNVCLAKRPLWKERKLVHVDCIGVHSRTLLQDPPTLSTLQHAFAEARKHRPRSDVPQRSHHVYLNSMTAALLDYPNVDAPPLRGSKRDMSPEPTARKADSKVLSGMCPSYAGCVLFARICSCEILALDETSVGAA